MTPEETQMLYVLNERVINLSQDIAALTVEVRQLTVSAAHQPDMERRIALLEQWQTWGQRLMLGSIFTALVSAFVTISTVIGGK